jgi:hypothetical protein
MLKEVIQGETTVIGEVCSEEFILDASSRREAHRLGSEGSARR